MVKVMSVQDTKKEAECYAEWIKGLYKEKGKDIKIEVRELTDDEIKEVKKENPMLFISLSGACSLDNKKPKIKAEIKKGRWGLIKLE